MAVLGRYQVPGGRGLGHPERLGMGPFQQQHGVQRPDRKRVLLMRRVLVTLLVVVASLAACGRTPRGDQPGGGSAGQSDPNEGAPNIDWLHPLGGGITLSEASAASTYVSFKVVDPGLGSPTLIQVDDPSEVDSNSRMVAFVYNMPKDGVVNVEEQQAAPGMAENLVARAKAYAATPSPAPSDAQFEMVPLGKGQALLVSRDGVGAEVWVQDGVLFQVTGPTLAPDRAQDLALPVYASAAGSGGKSG